MGVLSNKVAVVTGAGSGQGAAVARLFALEGAKVVAADISGEEDRVARELGDDVLAVHVDVRLSADVKNMIDEAVSVFGRLDVVCNAAGVPSVRHSIADGDEDEFARQLDVNLRGTFLGMKYGIAPMVQGGGGCIVNWTSTSVTKAVPGTYGYATAKAGVGMLTRIGAAEYGRSGIRVNAIMPGMIKSGFQAQTNRQDYYDSQLSRMPLGRWGTPGEIARVALFLASDASSFVTGAMIPVDGGLTA